MELYEFLGRVLGKAMFEGIVVNPNFTFFFLKTFKCSISPQCDEHECHQEQHYNMHWSSLFLLSFLIFFGSEEIIDFIDKLTNNKKGFSREKAKNAVNSTSFENLKKIEETKGFSESIVSREQEKKIPFFHLGPKNDWKLNYDSKFIDKLNNIFEKNLIELKYK